MCVRISCDRSHRASYLSCLLPCLRLPPASRAEGRGETLQVREGVSKQRREGGGGCHYEPCLIPQGSLLIKNKQAQEGLSASPAGERLIRRKPPGPAFPSCKCAPRFPLSMKSEKRFF